MRNDLELVSFLLNETKEKSLEFLENLTTIPTSAKVNSAEEKTLNAIGFGGQATLELFYQTYKEVINSSTGPRYLGFVTGGATPASIMGDWLTSIYDQNTQATSGQGDLSANIETDTINLLIDLFNLPKDFLGGFVTGATMSNFSCMAVARQWVEKLNGCDIAKEGITKKISVLAATPHSSSIKSLSMLGLGSQNLIKIKTIEGNREAIDINDLEINIKKLNGLPFILITSGGTVNTVDYDDFKAISELKNRYNFWWHLDAAFGAFAACSHRFQHLLVGWENADSITIDNHKWLNVPYENAFFLIKEKHKILQVETFQNSNAPYLGNPLANFNYLNFLPENSRRLKALPVWFTLRAYGKQGYQDIVENSVDLAQYLGEFIKDNKSLELLAPVRLNTVCFTLKDGNPDDVNQFLSDINATGKVFMTPTFYNGKNGIRAAFVNWRTSKNDVNLVKNVILEKLNLLSL